MSFAIDEPGDAVLAVASRAKSALFLVAPFVKVQALERILDGVSSLVETTVVTRWHLLELVSGVSDLQIWPILRERGADLVLQPRLHAKIALSESEGIAGSANITGAALGWTLSPNDEVVLPALDEYFLALGKEVCRLARTGLLVDDSIYQDFCAHLEAAGGVEQSNLELHLVDKPGSAEVWIPLTRDPADLEALYFGKYHRLTTSATQAASSDLIALEVPSRLSSDLFRAHISLQLMQHPLVRELQRELVEPRRFGEALQIIRARSECTREEAVERLQTLMRWLLHFQPGRWQYQKARYSESLIFVGRNSPVDVVLDDGDFER